ncbi:MAG TPA: hypothetical protein IAC31_06230 [Candidatus Faecousia intestinigallinarum]|nr:hypothetical protein [Candidatus Faecousia intestinigallinarum]
MNSCRFYLSGASPALEYAKADLLHRGCDLAAEPDADVTHLLLPVPAFSSPGILKGGQPLAELLSQLPKTITVFGGDLCDKELSNYRKADFLQDAIYLSQNAAITAHCAVKQLLPHLTCTLHGCQVLIIGWGRIGKCLAQLLRAMGAHVTVATRNTTHRALLPALGYGAVETAKLGGNLLRYRVIFNTAPFPVLSEEQVRQCRPDCRKIDLASQQGIAGEDVLWARGLPGKDAPESSGRLIAATAVRLAATEGTQ